MGVILVCVVFFGACSAFMAYKAIHNNVGLVINGIITLGPGKATVFYWVISALGAGFVFLALLLTARRIADPGILEVGPDAFYLPYGRFKKQTSRIACSEIQSVSEVQVSGRRFLYVTAGGLRFTITALLFPDTEQLCWRQGFSGFKRTTLTQTAALRLIRCDESGLPASLPSWPLAGRFAKLSCSGWRCRRKTRFAVNLHEPALRGPHRIWKYCPGVQNYSPITTALVCV